MERTADPDGLRPTTMREHLVGYPALALALIINNYAGHLADAQGETAGIAPDLLLGWLPHWDTSPLFIYGFTIFLIWLIAAGIWRERRRVLRILWSYAILVSLRSFFISLTPMHTPPDAIFSPDSPLCAFIGHHLTFKHDLFFSSHTALPFMAFLLFREAWVRISFLVISVIMAATVLIGRFHYSIDVFGAFFITYGLHTLESHRIPQVYAFLTGVRRS